MKSISLFVALLLSSVVGAQEAGTIGKLLRNEARASDINSVRIQVDVQGGRNKRPDLRQYRTAPDQYQWNRTPYSYSEVFLRIPDRGYFTVILGDQQISGATGKFRFFDVPSGAVPMSIYLDGFLVYRTTLMAEQNSRSVLDYFVQYGLYELAVYPVDRQWYGGDWNEIWNNPYQAGCHLAGDPRIPVMPEEVFVNFYKAYKRLHFDNERMAFVKQQKQTSYTSAQIGMLLQALDFESNKVEMGKQLYEVCADKGNFFNVYSVFTFDNYKEQLMEYVTNK